MGPAALPWVVGALGVTGMVSQNAQNKANLKNAQNAQQTGMDQIAAQRAQALQALQQYIQQNPGVAGLWQALQQPNSFGGSIGGASGGTFTPGQAGVPQPGQGLAMPTMPIGSQPVQTLGGGGGGGIQNPAQLQAYIQQKLAQGGMGGMMPGMQPGGRSLDARVGAK